MERHVRRKRIFHINLIVAVSIAFYVAGAGLTNKMLLLTVWEILIFPSYLARTKPALRGNVDGTGRY